MSLCFCVIPFLLLVTKVAHCNRIFARSPHCSGVVSHALLCVLIAASAVQHARAVLVGLSLRRQDANGTGNIPQVARTTEAIVLSMWKRAVVNKLNAPALVSEILPSAHAFLFTVLLLSFASNFLSRLETFRLRSFFVEVSISPSVNPALVCTSAERLLNGCVLNSGKDHVEHQRRVSSIRHLVHFVATAAVVLRDNIYVRDTQDARKHLL